MEGDENPWSFEILAGDAPRGLRGIPLGMESNSLCPRGLGFELKTVSENFAHKFVQVGSRCTFVSILGEEVDAILTDAAKVV
jgi:hypothetical protein